LPRAGSAAEPAIRETTVFPTTAVDTLGAGVSLRRPEVEALLARSEASFGGPTEGRAGM